MTAFVSFCTAIFNMQVTTLDGVSITVGWSLGLLLVVAVVDGIWSLVTRKR